MIITQNNVTLHYNVKMNIKKIGYIIFKMPLSSPYSLHFKFCKYSHNTSKTLLYKFNKIFQCQL